MIRYRINKWLNDIVLFEIWLYNTKTKKERLVYSNDGYWEHDSGWAGWETYLKPDDIITETYLSKKDAEELMFLDKL